MGFNSWQDFEEFEKEVKYQNRFVHSDIVSEFFGNIRRTLPLRARSVAQGTPLFRGQVGYKEYEHNHQPLIQGFPPERMKPLPTKGREGRANPKGISYLYLANDEKTALSELRPQLGEYLSSALFETTRDINVVDCYSVPQYISLFQCIFNPPVSQDDITNAIWSRINEAFTKPVTNVDDASDYVPTQILAEYFKSEGYDGVCLKSGLGPGYNFILFNLDDANVMSCTVKEAVSVDYNFKECGQPYVLK